MPGVPVARKGIQNKASPDRAFQLDLLAGGVKPRDFGFVARRPYFLSAGLRAVQGTLGITGPLPSTSLIFADCISSLTPTTSKTPSCWVLPTWSPRFGTVILAVATFASSQSRFLSFAFSA
jgi:hypothetical protein